MAIHISPLHRPRIPRGQRVHIRQDRLLHALATESSHALAADGVCLLGFLTIPLLTRPHFLSAFAPEFKFFFS